ncbi:MULTISPECIES: hypothetical protein [Microbacterium]|uniref:hypothetical protein n=1 Tax=Microbacterium TaxID=33882 RepID=UPI000D013487|nr:hypothetical protein [Microbacterium sp. str. 'China']AVL96915.1 hypothetical protein C6C15_07255 [Microbacterium sp. str. 'China']
MTCDTGDWACELSRIADAMNGFDWNAFAATLLATIIGAAVAAGVSFLLAERDRPRPVWKTDAKLGSSDARDGEMAVTVTITNVGDGIAYHPRMEVRGRDVSGRKNEEAAILRPGESFTTHIGVPGSGEIGVDEATLNTTDSRAVDWSGGVAVFLQWNQPPRRKRTRDELLSVSPPAP